MTQPNSLQSRAALRKLINDNFLDEDINNFCFDHFPEVYSNFGSGATKDTKIRKLLEYAISRNQLANLVSDLAKERPELNFTGGYSQQVANTSDNLEPANTENQTIKNSPTPRPVDRRFVAVVAGIIALIVIGLVFWLLSFSNGKTQNNSAVQTTASYTASLPPSTTALTQITPTNSVAPATTLMPQITSTTIIAPSLSTMVSKDIATKIKELDNRISQVDHTDPISRELTINNDRTPYPANVTYKDFKVTVQFCNFEDNTTEFGFAFRGANSIAYFLVFNKDKSKGNPSWKLQRYTNSNNQEADLYINNVPNLKVEKDSCDKITLYAYGDIGYLIVNDTYKTQLDLSNILQFGNIKIYLTGKEGKKVNIEDFQVWKLDD